jgi:hypothetical protein
MTPTLLKGIAMIRVIKIAPETLDIIAEVNDGLKPEIESTPTYYVDWCDEGIYNDIIDEHTLRQAFNFVNPEIENDWNEVVDK